MSIRLPNRTEILALFGKDPSATVQYNEWEPLKIYRFGFLSSDLKFRYLTSTELDRFGWLPRPPHNVIGEYHVSITAWNRHWHQCFERSRVMPDLGSWRSTQSSALCWIFVNFQFPYDVLSLYHLLNHLLNHILNHSFLKLTVNFYKQADNWLNTTL